MTDEWCCSKCQAIAYEASPLCYCGTPKDSHTEECTCGPDVTSEDIDMCPGCARLDRSHPDDRTAPF